MTNEYNEKEEQRQREVLLDLINKQLTTLNNVELKALYNISETMWVQGTANKTVHFDSPNGKDIKFDI